MLFATTLSTLLAVLAVASGKVCSRGNATSDCNHSQGQGINKDVTCRPSSGCAPPPGNAVHLADDGMYMPNITNGGITPALTINIPYEGVGFQFVGHDGYFNCFVQFSQNVTDTLLTLSGNGTYTTVWGDGSSRVGGCVKVADLELA